MFGYIVSDLFTLYQCFIRYSLHNPFYAAKISKLY
jgi:hypothetical protein